MERRELKETAVCLVPKEQLAYMENNTDFIDHLVKNLSSELVERLMGILEREDEIVVRQSELRVRDFIPTNSVEYRREIIWDELVRCRYCKHWDKTWTNDWSPDYHYCPMIDGVRKGDFYCSDGERREDAEIH